LKQLWSDAATDILRAYALTGLGVLAYFQSDYPEAIKHCEPAFLLSNQIGEVWLAVVAASAEATAQFFSGNAPRAVSLLQYACATADMSGDPWLQSLAIGTQAIVEAFLLAAEPHAKDAVEKVVQKGRKAVQWARQTGNHWILSVGLINQGVVLRTLKVYSNDKCAGRLFKRSLELRHEISDRYGLIQSLIYVAATAFDNGDHDRATILLGGQSTLLHADESFIPIPKLNLEEFSEMRRQLENRTSFAECFACGQQLSVGKLVAFALSEQSRP
jgi:hypothetical protein